MVFKNTSQGILLFHKDIFVDKMLIICYYISDYLWKTFGYDYESKEYRLLTLCINLSTIT